MFQRREKASRATGWCTGVVVSCNHDYHCSKSRPVRTHRDQVKEMFKGRDKAHLQ
ncbi:hypothetical protein BDV06DRAFT_200494 [Aspergillus oleicola]